MHNRNKKVIFSEYFYYYFLDSETLLYQCQNIGVYLGGTETASSGTAV